MGDLDPPSSPKRACSFGGVGGDVSDGVFVLALPQKDLGVTDLTWRFLAFDGTVIMAGSGLSPSETTR